jgi:hypothetical protein
MEKIERRGRPSAVSSDPGQQPKQFVREYKDYTGHRSVWTYDLDKNPYGPISVEEFYPKGSEEDLDPADESIPKSKRKYLNPENGKYVGYARAYQLGLIK